MKNLVQTSLKSKLASNVLFCFKAQHRTVTVGDKATELHF